MTYINDEIETQEFAKLAAERFAGNKELYSFTKDKIIPGCLFALRWGLGEDCVVVFKLDENFEPINFQQLVKKYTKE